MGRTQWVISTRDSLPEDLKELIGLCRAGKLFAVEEWLASGRRYTLPPGRFLTSPFLSAMDSGFHSLVEVFLRAGISQEDKDDALRRAVVCRRLDLVELLVAYGADAQTLDADDIIGSRHPAIIRWFVERGLDMESGNPIGRAFEGRHREFLGIYMDLRDRVPSARTQAAMALRVHCRDGNLKWVSLLLWAGADPRQKVPKMTSRDPEEDIASSLDDAVTCGQIDIVRKIGIDPMKDDMTALLGNCWLRPQPELVRMLLMAGADPNGGGDDWSNPMLGLMNAFEFSLEETFGRGSPEPRYKVSKLPRLLAVDGARGNPTTIRDCDAPSADRHPSPSFPN